MSKSPYVLAHGHTPLIWAQIKPTTTYLHLNKYQHQSKRESFRDFRLGKQNTSLSSFRDFDLRSSPLTTTSFAPPPSCPHRGMTPPPPPPIREEKRDGELEREIWTYFWRERELQRVKLKNKIKILRWAWERELEI